jgi:hypothetical protein
VDDADRRQAGERACEHAVLSGPQVLVDMDNVRAQLAEHPPVFEERRKVTSSGYRREHPLLHSGAPTRNMGDDIRPDANDDRLERRMELGEEVSTEALTATDDR